MIEGIMKNIRVLVGIMLVLLPVISCTSRKDRLTSNTMNITIDPCAGQILGTGTTLSLNAVCRSPSAAAVDIQPEWSVENDLGTFSNSSGRATVFTAGPATGSGNIYATYKGVIGQVNIIVKTANNDIGATTVYSDTFATGLDQPGAFWEYGDSILLSTDNTASSEGIKSFKAIYTIDGAGWAGWYIASLSQKDMSGYASGYLKFDIKSAYDIQIGIRSSNVSSNVNNAKRYVSQYALLDGTSFVPVSIPIADLIAGQPSTDLTKIEDVFIATAMGSKIGAKTNKSFWIDNIRWTLQ